MSIRSATLSLAAIAASVSAQSSSCVVSPYPGRHALGNLSQEIDLPSSSPTIWAGGSLLAPLAQVSTPRFLPPATHYFPPTFNLAVLP